MTDSLPIVLVSHRSPVSFRTGADGEREATRGGGGLVTALAGMADRFDDAVWVAAADSVDDAAAAREAVDDDGAPQALSVQIAPVVRVLGPGEEHPDGARVFDVRMLELDPDEHDRMYGTVANPMLWFVQHDLYGLASAPTWGRAERDAYERGYRPVNQAFADAVVEEVERRGGRARVMLQDYHLYLVGRMIRDRLPDSLISHFVHIPWPSPDSWRVLPEPMRSDLLHGLTGCDVVGFHTSRSARNFLSCLREVLGADVDLAALTAVVDGRTVKAAAYPISVDPEWLGDLAASDEVAAHRVELTAQLLDGHRSLVLRVDRTDPSKNIVRGFLAFGQMLDDHPELAGRVTFLALLQPSRQDVAEYVDYVSSVGAVVAEVNARHSTPAGQPIDLRMVNDLPLAVAAYSLCDVLMVNAVADGMNLVAKEAVLVNDRDGVLALSENTGAHEELGPFAVTLHPFDVQQQADALYDALTRDRGRRARDLAAAADWVRTHDVHRWVANQLQDLDGLPDHT